VPDKVEGGGATSGGNISGSLVLSGVYDPTRAPSRTMAGEAATSKSALLVRSAQVDNRFQAAESIHQARIETAIVAPLLCRNESAAVLYVDRLGGLAFEERDLRLLGLIANHVSSALENATLVDELRKASAQLAQANEQLSRLNADLEAKVESRTAEVRQQASEIQKLAAEKDEILGVAAHDIRGPLTTILGFLELARMNLTTADTASLDEDLAVIEEAARKATFLLSDLLDVKKIEAGKIHFQPVEIDAGGFLDAATALGVLQARQSRVTFSVFVEPGLKLYADPHRLEQAVQNLVANALKFTPEGGTVTVQAGAAPSGVEVSVVDTGPGITPEELSQLFTAFVQGEAGRKGVGTGLGLAIAKKLVELHGGRIYVESAPGKGSRFAFVIPGRPASRSA
jgi:signal transduction histidine kinase